MKFQILLAICTITSGCSTLYKYSEERFIEDWKPHVEAKYDSDILHHNNEAFQVIVRTPRNTPGFVTKMTECIAPKYVEVPDPNKPSIFKPVMQFTPGEKCLRSLYPEKYWKGRIRMRLDDKLVTISRDDYRKISQACSNRPKLESRCLTKTSPKFNYYNCQVSPCAKSYPDKPDLYMPPYSPTASAYVTQEQFYDLMLACTDNPMVQFPIFDLKPCLEKMPEFSNSVNEFRPIIEPRSRLVR